MRVAMLPCPFCGGGKLKTQEAGRSDWAVYCKNEWCNVYGPTAISKVAARDKWNDRIIVKPTETTPDR